MINKTVDHKLSFVTLDYKTSHKGNFKFLNWDSCIIWKLNKLSIDV